jgi:carbamoyltransferase
VLAPRAGEYFELDRESPYMLLVAPVKEDRRLPFERGEETDLLTVVRKLRSDIPAVTHVDYSARVQTVTREDHPDYYDLIEAFERRTGCAVIVNTSFNVRGEPIICTPYDAYRCFMRTEMDYLVLGDFLLQKMDQPPWPEAKGHIEEYEAKTADFEPSLLKSLNEIYRNEFAPVAGQLRSSGALEVSTHMGRAPSLWSEFDSQGGPKAAFEIPPELDYTPPDPLAMSDAMTSCWRPGAATQAFRPVLRRLLELGKQHPPREAFDEAVSESMYVLF